MEYQFAKSSPNSEAGQALNEMLDYYKSHQNVIQKWITLKERCNRLSSNLNLVEIDLTMLENLCDSDFSQRVLIEEMLKM
jgi:hypothetical protein